MLALRAAESACQTVGSEHSRCVILSRFRQTPFFAPAKPLLARSQILLACRSGVEALNPLLGFAHA
jgi:hypothetical protein